MKIILARNFDFAAVSEGRDKRGMRRREGGRRERERERGLRRGRNPAVISRANFPRKIRALDVIRVRANPPLFPLKTPRRTWRTDDEVRNVPDYVPGCGNVD